MISSHTVTGALTAGNTVPFIAGTARSADANATTTNAKCPGGPHPPKVFAPPLSSAHFSLPVFLEWLLRPLRAAVKKY